MSGYKIALNRGKVLIGLAFLLLAICVPILLATESVSAAGGPKSIWGYVYDENGVPADGATVTVSVWNNANVETSGIDVTHDGGFYEVIFNDGSVWDIGKQVRAIADDGVSQSPPSTDTLVAGPDQQVDVHYPTAIPQFGSAIGLAFSAGIVGVVAVVAVTRRRDS